MSAQHQTRNIILGTKLWVRRRSPPGFWHLNLTEQTDSKVLIPFLFFLFQYGYPEITPSLVFPARNRNRQWANRKPLRERHNSGSDRQQQNRKRSRSRDRTERKSPTTTKSFSQIQQQRQLEMIQKQQILTQKLIKREKNHARSIFNSVNPGNLELFADLFEFNSEFSSGSFPFSSNPFSQSSIFDSGFT